MEGVSKGFPGGSEGFQGFRQCDPRQELFENVGRCAESRIRGRRRRPDEQTPNIILNREIQDASSNFNTSDVAIGAWGNKTSGLLEFYQPRICTRLLFDSFISSAISVSSVI